MSINTFTEFAIRIEMGIRGEILQICFETRQQLTNKKLETTNTINIENIHLYKAIFICTQSLLCLLLGIVRTRALLVFINCPDLVLTTVSIRIEIEVANTTRSSETVQFVLPNL